jgi:hypothetical protein
MFPKEFNEGVGMKIQMAVVSAFMVGVLALTGQLLGHHSVNWAERTESTITGTVVEFSFTNPHAMMVVQAKDGQKWSIESSSPARLRRAGWTRATVKAGDQIVVTGGKAKDGSLLMNAHKFVVNGKEVAMERDDPGEY